MNQCYGEQFKKADAHLNVVYRKVLGFMHDNLSDAQRRAATDEVKNYETAVDKLRRQKRHGFSIVTCIAMLRDTKFGAEAWLPWSGLSAWNR